MPVAPHGNLAISLRSLTEARERGVVSATTFVPGCHAGNRARPCNPRPQQLNNLLLVALQQHCRRLHGTGLHSEGL